jgi:hypothetical protein
MTGGEAIKKNGASKGMNQIRRFFFRKRIFRCIFGLNVINAFPVFRDTTTLLLV